MLEHPCIFYAARYEVGTISRKGPPQAEILRDYTRRVLSNKDHDIVRSLWRHRAREIAARIKNMRLLLEQLGLVRSLLWEISVTRREEIHFEVPTRTNGITVWALSRRKVR